VPGRPSPPDDGDPAPAAPEPPPRPVSCAAAASSEEPQVVRLDTPSLRGILRILLVVVASAFALYIAWRIRTVILLAAISLFLALAMVPAVDAIESRLRVPRGAIILVCYVLLATAVVLIGYVVIPSTVKEVEQLSRDAPRYARDLRENATFRHYDNRYRITPRLVHDAQRLPQVLGHLAGPLQQVTVSAFSFIGQLITVLAVTFLLVLHGREYVNMGLSLMGESEARYRRLIIDVDHAVANYTLGNVVISLLATTATWIVLSILGVPYALSLGFVVGFFDLIPLVGATIGAIVVVLATVGVNFPVATIAWIAFIIAWQRVEDYVVQPFVYGRALHVNPIVTILAVLAGATLLGILGALIAIPTAAAIQIVLSDWWAARQRTRTASVAADSSST
jgi:predicted PurR-regulated permease PerM